jgi:hypothetical protein
LSCANATVEASGFGSRGKIREEFHFQNFDRWGFLRAMDSHPDKIEFEIDREGLRRSLRASFLTAWAGLGGFLMFFCGALAISRGQDAGLSSGLKLLTLCAVGTAAILFVGYFTLTRRTLNRCVDAVSLKVDGPYLLVHTYEVGSRSWHDRKLHFKSIVDYGIFENSNMRRYGVKALKLTTMAGGLSSDVIIPAVRNCQQVRDLLSEIDHARENS